MTVRARRAPIDLTPVLDAVTNDWEPGRVIADRAGIDPKTGGPRLAALVREGKVEFTHDADLDVRVYRLARDLPPAVGVALVETVDVALTETSWVPQGDMSYEQWADAFGRLQRMNRCCNWWLGDALIWGEAHYGDRYTQAIELTGLEVQTLMNVTSVARRVEPERRRESLSWSHHEVVASLPAAEQDRWLEEAEQEGMTRNRLRSRLSGTPKDAPDPDQQLAATHVGQIHFKFVAESSDAAHDKVKELAAKLERLGVQVSHKTAKAL